MEGVVSLVLGEVELELNDALQLGVLLALEWNADNNYDQLVMGDTFERLQPIVKLRVRSEHHLHNPNRRMREHRRR